MSAIIDILVGIAVLISALLAMIRGFMREILSAGAWVAAIAAALFAYVQWFPVETPWFGSTTATTILVIGGTFVCVLLVISIVTVRVSDMVLDSRISEVDRIAGFGWGLARGIFIVAAIFWITPQSYTPEVFNHATSPQMLRQTFDRIVPSRFSYNPGTFQPDKPIAREVPKPAEASTTKAKVSPEITIVGLAAVAALILATVILKKDLPNEAKAGLAIGAPILSSLILLFLGLKDDFTLAEFTLINVPMGGALALALLYKIHH